jgi:SAM-dependent methyltransferase
MGSSTHYAIPRVLWLAERLKPQSVLDVGCGGGKYGVLLRFILEEIFDPSCHDAIRIDGLDAFKPNLTHWHQLYNQLHIGDLRDLLPKLESYDVIYFGDIIEHFEKEEGREILRVLLPKARMGVIVTTPYHFFEQGALGGNEFERHRSLWKKKDFKVFPHARCWIEYRRKLVALVSGNSLPPLLGEKFQRSWLSSTFEHLCFSGLGFRLGRRLKRLITGVSPESSEVPKG